MPALADTPPRLVVFDVDGTLQDTCGWWPRVLRAGLAAFAAERRLTIDAPSDHAACAVLGKADAEVWSGFLPASHQHLWPELRAALAPSQVEELCGGVDHAFPGTRALLAALGEAKVATALISNCRRSYFAAVRTGLGLAFLTDWQFCLDSPGIASKADMVGAALAAAGTRAAVVVGDREGDLEAARAHSLPFVWRRNRYWHGAGADALWGGDREGLLAILGLRAASGPAAPSAAE